MGNNHSKCPAGLLLILVLFSWLTACKKDNSGPTKKDPCPWPEITTEGKHTLGFKINGKEWVPCVDFYGAAVGLRPIDCRLRESDGSNFLAISSTRSVEDSTYADIGANGLFTLGFKPIKKGAFSIYSDLVYSSARFSSWAGPRIVYELIDSSVLNHLNITHLDTVKNTVPGQFQFTLIDEQTGQKIEITEGRFDLTYYEQ